MVGNMSTGGTQRWHSRHYSSSYPVSPIEEIQPRICSRDVPAYRESGDSGERDHALDISL